MSEDRYAALGRACYEPDGTPKTVRITVSDFMWMRDFLKANTSSLCDVEECVRAERLVAAGIHLTQARFMSAAAEARLASIKFYQGAGDR